MKRKQKGVMGIWLMMFVLLLPSAAKAQRLTVVEWNVENLFDTDHDTLKNDSEFTPEGSYHWTRTRYWRKLNRVGQVVVASGSLLPTASGSGGMGGSDNGWSLPDLVGLCEVENDTVLRDLTKRSLLRKARYEYVMTESPDLRGIDVALLFSPFSFRLIGHRSLRVEPLKGMRPTRDILYVSGELVSGDTLHVFLLHAPSRSGGEAETRAHRLHAMGRLTAAMDSLLTASTQETDTGKLILVMGDFNDYADDASLQLLYERGMVNVSRNARGSHGAKGTYRWHGKWGSLDQMLVSRRLAERVADCRIFDAEFLLETDEKYGGVKPRRNYLGPRYLNGYSDHLPLVLIVGGTAAD